MARGFITIATGDEKYFRFARNLLMSYRLYTDSPMPFAIACDQTNAYTALFDQVVLLSQDQTDGHSFWTKFELLLHAPYDETIFIDADCLAYGDLNRFWDYFSHAEDFTGCGTNYPIDSPQGLFQVDEIGAYRSRVRWKPVIHGGLYFIRKGPVCTALYEECRSITRHYAQFHWPDYCAPYADEPVLCLAMAALGLHATPADPCNYGIPWEVIEMEQDIFTGKLSYATAWHPRVPHGLMIHFSTRYCSKPVYLFEEEKLDILLKNNLKPAVHGEKLSLGPVNTLLYRWKLRYFYLCAKDFAMRGIGKIKRMIKGMSYAH